LIGRRYFEGIWLYVDAIIQQLGMSPLATPDVFTMYTEHVEGYGEVLHILEFCDV
jgi:hypothetical protein